MSRSEVRKLHSVSGFFLSLSRRKRHVYSWMKWSRRKDRRFLTDTKAFRVDAFCKNLEQGALCMSIERHAQRA
ncbi:MAG: hypothetical protein MI923_24150 [Phycisphaerales bacterium]|nr:hypothetical protein [Phycisphaerales bacterium]